MDLARLEAKRVETYEQVCVGTVLEFLEFLGNAEGCLGGHPCRCSVVERGRARARKQRGEGGVKRRGRVLMQRRSN